MKPALLALDFKNATARRYFPKPTGGFLTQQAILQKNTNESWQMGSEQGLAVLEAFRAGRLPVEDLPDADPAAA